MAKPAARRPVAPVRAAPPARRQPRPAVTGRPRPARRGRALLFLLVVSLAILPVVILATPIAILLGLGLVPTLVAYIVDLDDGKHAALTVGPLNLCGLVPAALTMWNKGLASPQVINMLGEPFTWLVIYGAAAIGWLIYFSVPTLAATIMAARLHGTIDGLERQQAALLEEWGPEVKAAADEAAAGGLG